MDAVVDDVVERLDEARLRARPLRAESDWPGLDLDQAYRAQAAQVARCVARGDVEVGLKLGFTSEAKMRQMGVDEVIVGRLTDAMQVAEGGVVPLGELIHPRVEPEVAFLIASDVDLTEPDVALIECVSGVAPALEVIDSRFSGFRFDLPRVVADNTSAAFFTVGRWSPLDALGHRAGVELWSNGARVAEGTTEAILGDPLRTLTRLASLGGRLGLRLPAGSIVLAGAATEAMPLAAGKIEVKVEGLGETWFEAKDGTDG